MLAGCTTVTDHEFAAAGSVIMVPDIATALGYQESIRETLDQSVNSQFLGLLDLSIHVSSMYAVYVNGAQMQETPTDRPTVSGYVTPTAEVFREMRNPLATLREPHVLRNPEGRWFLEASGIAGTENEWTRRPQLLNSARTDVFGGIDNRVRGYAGIIEADGNPTVVFANLTKLELEEDVMFGMAYNQWEVDDPDREFVGEDGYLTNEEWETEIAHAVEGLDALRYE